MRSLFDYGRAGSALLGMFVSVFVLFFNAGPAFAAQTTLAWSNISSADGYRVFHRVSGGSFDYENPIWSGSNTTCSIENLADDTTHFFVVRSFSGTNQSENSNEVSFHSLPAVVTYTIKAIPGENGAIDPAGELSITQNETQVFNITPAPGYQISDVRVDGASIGAVASYTFATIDRNHTIEAVFAPITSNPLPPDQDSGSSEPIQTPANGSAIILDNGEPGTRANGSWSVSSGSEPYGTTSLYSKEIGADYIFQAAIAGRYDISLWWSGYKSRCHKVPVEIFDGNRLIETVFVNQTENSGKWNFIGTFEFSESAVVNIVCESKECSTAADAIKFSALERRIIIDDGNSGTSKIGTWSISGGIDPYGTQSIYSRETGSAYSYEADINGSYDVELWWSGYKSRCSSVPVEIYDGAALLDIIYVNQTVNSGKWNTIGAYHFKESARVSVVANESSCSTAADAVAFAYQKEKIIDDGDPATSSVGDWSISGGSDPFGTQSLYSKERGAEYSYEIQLYGSYDVGLWWSGYKSRCSSVPVEIYDGTQLLGTVYIDQTINSGRWNKLGAYRFNGIAKVVVVAEGSFCSTAADALKFSGNSNP